MGAEVGLPVNRKHRLENNTIQLLHNGAQAYPAMLSAIRAAHFQVLLEMYHFDSDAIGQRFSAALIAKARAGVEVAVIYDSAGSIGTRQRMFERLEAAGVHVFEYHPVAPWRERFEWSLLWRRNHRKVLVVDQHRAFLGGINIANAWLPESEGGGGWRDDAIAIEGPLARKLCWGFLHTWRRYRRRAGLARLRQPPAAGPFERTKRLTVGSQLAVFRRHEVARMYLRQIKNAQKRIWLANPYFLPRASVRRALRSAAERGVDVRIMVPLHSDILLVEYGSRAVYKQLLKAGARIFEWTGPMLHTKTAVIDSRWGTVGTFNLDQRSWAYNLEVNIVVEHPGFAEDLETSFQRDLEHCAEIDLPVFNMRSLGSRILEWFAYRLRGLL